MPSLVPGKIKNTDSVSLLDLSLTVHRRPVLQGIPGRDLWSTLDNLYQEIILGIEEKETKHLGSFTFLIHFETIRHPQTRRESATRALLITGASEKDNTTLGPLPCQVQRALLNLGQTCFLNATLQALLPNPLLRNYFIGDKQNLPWCKNKDDSLFSFQTTYLTSSLPIPNGDASTTR